MSSRLHRSVHAIAVLAGILLFSLSGCAGPYVPTNWAAEEAKVIEIRANVQTVRLSISNDTGAITDDGREALYQALLNIGQIPSATAVLRPDRMNYQQAAASVRSLLTSQGLNPRGIVLDTGNVSASGSGIEVTLTGYTATVSNCPNWTYPNALKTVTSEVSNFGCATMMNLASSVSDPRDLARGRPLGPASGATAVAAITRYNAGETKELSTNNSMLAGGGSGSAQ